MKQFQVRIAACILLAATAALLACGPNTAVRDAELAAGLTRSERTSARLGLVLKAGRRSGILVDEVPPGSPGALAGFRKGDILWSIDGVEVHRPAICPKQELALADGMRLLEGLGWQCSDGTGLRPAPQSAPSQVVVVVLRPGEREPRTLFATRGSAPTQDGAGWSCWAPPLIRPKQELDVSRFLVSSHELTPGERQSMGGCYTPIPMASLKPDHATYPGNFLPAAGLCCLPPDPMATA